MFFIILANYVILLKKGRYTIMKFSAKIMKEVSTQLKKVVTDKNTATAFLKSNGDGVIHVYARSKFAGFYTTVPSLNDASFSIAFNPHELHPLFTANEKLKGDNKRTEFEFKVNKKSMREKNTGTTYKITEHEWDEAEFQQLMEEVKALPPKDEYQPEEYHFIPPSPWGYVENESLFLKVLKEANEIIKKNTDILTVYMQISSGKVMVTNKERAHAYRIEESFPFDTVYFHKDAVNLMATNIKAKKPILHKRLTNGLYFASQDYLFILDDGENVPYPDFRNITERKHIFSFEVNAKDINTPLKSYKKEVTHCLCQFTEDTMTVIPSHADFKTFTVPITITNGTPTECKFSTNMFKGFFGSFTKNVLVEHLEFENIKREVGYSWRIYFPEQLNVIPGISRLDWEFLDRLHREGQLANITKLSEAEELR